MADPVESRFCPCRGYNLLRILKIAVIAMFVLTVIQLSFNITTVDVNKTSKFQNGTLWNIFSLKWAQSSFFYTTPISDSSTLSVRRTTLKQQPSTTKKGMTVTPSSRTSRKTVPISSTQSGDLVNSASSEGLDPLETFSTANIQQHHQQISDVTTSRSQMSQQVTTPVQTSTPTTSGQVEAKTTKLTRLPLCPNPVASSPGGPIRVVESGDLSISHLESKFPNVEAGGRWRPTGCRARQRIAILVPYRDREKELSVFLNHMHPFLQRQQLDYAIYLIEQSPSSDFNRGMLFNIGFLEVNAKGHFDCVIMHDVDVLPEDDRIRYTCSDHPHHLSAACSSWGYKLLYQTVFGGVTAFTPRQFLRINGYSNGYFRWGAEDDDLYNRVTYYGYKIRRYPIAISRFKTLSHKAASKNTRRMYYLDRWKLRISKDGLNSAVYKILSTKKKKLYTHFIAEIDQNLIMKHVDGLLDSRIAQSLTTVSIDDVHDSIYEYTENPLVHRNQL